MEEELADALGEITGGWASSEDMKRAMKAVYESYDYLMDPHTAVAYAVYHRLAAKGR